MDKSPEQTWFITGASRGIGRAWARAALERGHRVVASSRNPDDTADLVAEFGDRAVAVRLDVTDRAAVHTAIDDVVDRFGRLDVVVNNAGFGLDGVVETVSEADARALMETNFFGALWVSQAAARVMRTRGSGRLVQMSSQGGHMAYAGFGLYHASKWALEGLTEALHLELAPFGVHTILVEPGAVISDWFGSIQQSATESAYSDILDNRYGDFDPSFMPKPPAVVAAAMQAVEAPNPPTRLAVTAAAYDTVVAASRDRLATWAAWENVSRSATPRLEERQSSFAT